MKPEDNQAYDQFIGQLQNYYNEKKTMDLGPMKCLDVMRILRLMRSERNQLEAEIRKLSDLVLENQHERTLRTRFHTDTGLPNET